MRSIRGITIGIHPDQVGEESYSKKWTEFLSARGVEVRTINLLSQGALCQARQCDGVMWRWLHNPSHKQSARNILFAIEHYYAIPVFPDISTCWHFDEKIFQYFIFQAMQVPSPTTWLFWDRDSALEWALTAPYPVVFKLSSGAGSANILKVENHKQARQLIDRAFHRGFFPYTMNEYKQPFPFPISHNRLKSLTIRLIDILKYCLKNDYPPLNPIFWKPEFGYAYFQEFLPANSYDTRISVIGNRAFGYRRTNRENDFRASGSGKFDTDPKLIDLKCVEIAFNVSRGGRFQSMAYDFLYKHDKPVIVEISYGFVDWMVKNCPGHWDQNLNWIEGEMWPEEAQVIDFLAHIESVKDFQEKNS